jgi:hypothetical protein
MRPLALLLLRVGLARFLFTGIQNSSGARVNIVAISKTFSAVMTVASRSLHAPSPVGAIISSTFAP